MIKIKIINTKITDGTEKGIPNEKIINISYNGFLPDNLSEILIKLNNKKYIKPVEKHFDYMFDTQDCCDSCCMCEENYVCNSLCGDLEEIFKDSYIYFKNVPSYEILFIGDKDEDN